MKGQREDDFAAATDRTVETLEQRLQRLEDAVAALQDTRQIEERLIERLATQQPRPAPPPAAPPPPPERLEEKVTAVARPAPPPEPALPSQAEVAARVLQAAPTVIKQAWLVVEMYSELRAIARMFFDVRYTVGWWTRLMVLVLVPLILISGYLMPFTTVPILGTFMLLLDKVLDLLLAFFLYKSLSREAHRYMQVQAARYGGS